MHPDLDLQGTIRPGLDILANEIVIGLKKRSRFSINAPVYEHGLVIPYPKQSLLHYELARVEECHAELGRYSFVTQDSFTDVSQVANVLDRKGMDSPVQPMASGVGQRIIDFYTGWIEKFCDDGDEPGTYGETVTADVAVLLAMMERVNLGKQVAESKFVELTDEFYATAGDRDAMLKLIVRKDREEKVIELARNLATHYGLSEEAAVAVFTFMISVTVDLEIEYLRMRMEKHQ